MNTEEICNRALYSVKGLLTTHEYSECHDYINKYGEWLLGLEFAIDFLVEEERKINSESFSYFEDAFIQMKQGKNERLADLRSLLKDENKT